MRTTPTPQKSMKIALLIASVAFVLLFPIAPAPAGSMNVLHAFNSTDGFAPTGGKGLVIDSAGNLYGATTWGGTQNSGVIYELSPGQNGQYSYKVLYNFCSQSGCTDGAGPSGSLIIDTSGNLYGVTHGPVPGQVFALVQNSGTWTLMVIHQFCGFSCGDGDSPVGGLTYSGAASGAPYDETSPLFGPTSSGGAYDFGAVFELDPGTNGWSEELIYSFCPQQYCADGYGPYAPLTEDQAGNLYGTTLGGGSKGNGLVFELSPLNGSWNESVLESTCTRKNCPAGSGPFGAVNLNPSGDLVGFAMRGGNRPDLRVKCRKTGCGVIFSITTNRSKPTVSTIYSFCSLSDSCADGGWPTDIYDGNQPIFDSNGDIFGMTEVGYGSRVKTQ